jgi:hypothetical protein
MTLVVQQPNLTLDSVTGSQGPPFTNFDVSTKLVAGREIALQLKGTLTPDKSMFGSCFDTSVSVPVEVTVAGLTLNPLSVPLAGVASLLRGTGIVKLPSIDQTGPQLIEVSLDPGHTLFATGDPTTLNATTVAVGLLNLDYFNIMYDGTTVADFGVMVNQTQKYLRAVYPLSSSSPMDLAEYQYIGGTAFSAPLDGPTGDLMYLSLVAFKSGANRTIGIAPDAYFQHYFPPKPGEPLLYGLARRALNAALVRDGYVETAAHELAHTYGLYWPIDLYQYPGNAACSGPNAIYDNTVVPGGFWLETGTIVNGAFNYMCNSPDFGLPSSSPSLWTTVGDWSYLFGKFAASGGDPEVLLVGGYVAIDGSAAFGPVFQNSTGTVTASSSSDYAVRVLDGAGVVISTVGFTPDFNMDEQPAGIQSSNLAPFVLSLGYPSGAAQIQIAHGNTVLTGMNIASGLLYNVIKMLPDAAFDVPSQRRNALLNKIAALDAQLSAGAIQGARNSLQNDLENSLQNWLVDGYTVQNPLEYTKDQIIALVNELIQRLGS